jgi:tRNA nucleotidyltransferase (CCA-adding enzyme)
MSYDAVFKHYGPAGFAVPERAPAVGSFPMYADDPRRRRTDLRRPRYALAILASPNYDRKPKLRARAVRRILTAHPSLRSMWARAERTILRRLSSKARPRKNPRVAVSDLLAAVPAEIKAVAHRLRQAGAKRVMLVGGAVIDLLQGHTVKDWDLEVFGLSMERLLAASRLMGQADDVGKAFGIVKLRLPSGLDLDLNVPRRDSKTGEGHRDFDVAVDPRMTVAEAARRRDFTINAMSVDLSTGELVDPYGGLADLRRGILRATDPELFKDDPLRALRAMQLIARKVDKVDPATLQLLRSMADAHPHLPAARILEEWRKLLLKGSTPSRGLQLLKDSGWIKHYPELDVLASVPQHPEWHPEGDVWVHTKQAADAAAMVRHLVPEHQREAFVYGTMLHDVGKATTTVTPEMVRAGLAPAERLYTAYGHDVEGRAPASQFLERIGAPKKTAALATELVAAHMRPYSLVSGKAKRAGYARLSRDLAAAGGDLHLLARVCQCDACATGRLRGFTATGDPDWEHETSVTLLQWASDLGTSPSEPVVQGRDLIQLGYKPGRDFGPLLEYAMSLQDEGMTREEILPLVDAFARERGARRRT